MNIITPLRRLALPHIVALLRGTMLLVIVLARLGMNLVSSTTPTKAAPCALTCYGANDMTNVSNDFLHWSM
jgi:hypothetical protein